MYGKITHNAERVCVCVRVWFKVMSDAGSYQNLSD